MNAALREYVTRIGFSLSLSSNQIDTFGIIAWRVLHWRTFGKETSDEPPLPSCAVVAVQKLVRIGLITHTDPTKMTPPWSRCVWDLTPAGEAVLALLIEADLVQKPRFQTKKVA